MVNFFSCSNVVAMIPRALLKSTAELQSHAVELFSGFTLSSNFDQRFLSKRKKQDGRRSEVDNCGGNRRWKGLISWNVFGTLFSDDDSNYKHCIFPQDFTFKAHLLSSFQSVKAILDLGVDANSCSPEGFRPICIAAFWGYNSIVRLLLNRG